ncbi:hypothetical protein M408DRAFT_332615 [Serendipita vermifera MAFF 305830]|uniref:RING-type domain-containing protein n=1 Tax=Serendipita vermifera MAFF 305830 TaxID=933852 RepID=A0A0C3AE52_SERVB|nr:hypothetical protein M408DRAFT_332615 [Serendipita vermifera MAFF 305830]
MSDFEHHTHADEPDEHSRPLHLETLDESQLTRVYEMIMDAQRLAGPMSAARHELIGKLERVEESKLVKDKLLNERCSICYTPFGALIAEEEMMLAMDTPGASERSLGVTRLQRCGHYFCRKDISKWILEGNDLCPYCRAPYLANTTGNDAAPANPASGGATPHGGQPEEDELEAAVRLFEERQQQSSLPSLSGSDGFLRVLREGAGQQQQWRRPASHGGSSMYS